MVFRKNQPARCQTTGPSCRTGGRQQFCQSGASDAWLRVFEPIGTAACKPHLAIAPCLIIDFAPRRGQLDDGTRPKNNDVLKRVGTATGFLIAALYDAGVVVLTHAPNPMKFLDQLPDRPASQKAGGVFGRRAPGRFGHHAPRVVNIK